MLRERVERGRDIASAHAPEHAPRTPEGNLACNRDTIWT